MRQRTGRRGAILGAAALMLAAPGWAAHAADPAAGSLTATDQAAIVAAQAYLQSLPALTANFLQVAPDGTTRSGKAWLQRPGKMRFEYDPPDPQLLVAGFGLLVFHDPAVNQTTNLPLSATPLGILLAKQVALSGAVTVTGVQHQPGEMLLTLIRTGKPEQGSLTLVFSTDPLELRQWIVTDQQSRVTRVSLYDMAPGGPFPDSLFEYNPQSQTNTNEGG